MNRTTGLDWEQRFVDEDTPWERGGVHPAIVDWQADGLLTQGQSIFVPGCGRSEEPLAFANMGLQVTGLDISPTPVIWQIERFREANMPGSFVKGDGLVWQPERPFDLYYEQTFLCALHPDQRDAYETAAYVQIRPGGKLLALFMQRDEQGGPPYRCDLKDMRDLFPDDRWGWPKDEPRFYPHPRLEAPGLGELGLVLTRL